ncbi:MAG: CDP-alcohol phosphatidyltransferase family protein [Gammaproteobacteria bacterium]|jgi:CDP-diacylglycerol--serine O-phosphatidyltransferase|uniref:CDP-diacylglycerol--serine O-phosphatidyltransferase n=1 Tax=SAR86 cluster bacterium SAR86B TaxID=1123867 RepID=J5KEZ1_9GAMM|nr:MAG: CDP-diacylglycerol--serine O-phosphatidyltransferase [SAR86 cluster bacterium SAR86B]
MKKINLRSLLPNLITLSGLSFGLSSMRFAIEGEFNLAVICILFAAICDALDGMLARHLDSESDLGFQLDSLSDFLSFGIAPGLLMYMAIFDQNSMGAFAALIFIVFSCLRLALFNVLHEKSKNNDSQRIDFFTGIPTPAGAILIMLPLTHVYIGYDWAYENLNFVAGYIILISGLLVSKIPTFSIKGRDFFIKSKLVFLMLFSGLVLSMINFPWHTLNVLALIYFFTIPFSILSWQRQRFTNS